MNMKNYLESACTHLEDIRNIKKLRGEASARNFFRIHFTNYSVIAVVYPEENKKEIENIVRLTDLYQKYKLNVPQIKEVIDNRIILQEDLGDILVQKAFSRFTKEEKKKTLQKIAGMVTTLGSIPTSRATAVLDTARQQWEMDFFVSHFARNFCTPSLDFENLRQNLHRLVEHIGAGDTFAHRDFHSRNMLFYKDDIFLVDFQDSLQAPVFYDLVSFAFDAYLDLKSLRTFFTGCLKKKGLKINDEQFLLTALQRNIKALGTFGYQVTVRKNLNYKRYINRTIRYILDNPLFKDFLTPSIFINLSTRLKRK